MDSAFKSAPYASMTTAQLKAAIAEGRGNPTMAAEVERRAKRDAGDTSVMTAGERLRHVHNQPKLERYDADAMRITRNGAVVGMVLRLSNDRWSLNDKDEKRLTKLTFATPAAALAHAERTGLAALLV